MSSSERQGLLGPGEVAAAMEHSESDEKDSDTESETAEFEPDAQAYGVERERYFVLGGLALVNGANAMLWMTYTAVVNPTEDYYNMSQSQLNTLNIIPPAIYCAMFWLSGAILPKTGLGWGLVLCAVINVLSALSRLFSVWFVHSYALVMASNVLSGIAQVLVLCVPPMVSNQWFALEERNFSTGVGVAAQIFGSALGVLLPSNMVLEASTKQFEELYWVQFGLTALGLIVTVLVKKAPTLPPTAAAFKFDENVTRRSFHHERLPSASTSKNGLTAGDLNAGGVVSEGKKNDNYRSNPPSAGALSARSSQSPNYKPSTRKYIKRAIKDIIKTLKAIVTNKPFILLLVVSGLGQGSIWTVGTLLLQIVQPFGVSQTTIGWIGFGGQIVGGMASIIIGSFVGRCKDYKPALVGLTVATTVAFMLFPITAVIVGEDSLSVTAANILSVFLYIGLCVVGVPQCPILFELGVEVTFPLSEEITSPMIMWPPSFLSLIFVTLEGMILTQNPTKEDSLIVMYINVGLFMLCTGAALILKPQYNRRLYELQHAKETAAATQGPHPQQQSAINASV